MFDSLSDKLEAFFKKITGDPRVGDPRMIVDSEKELKKVTAIIDSMTPQEGRFVAILNGSRRLRIARGSGTQVSDVNKLVKQFLQTKKMMKKISKFGRRSPIHFFE